jgi:uncharacterized protein YbcI
MKTPKSTRGQLERSLTQRIQALYFEELGKRPQKVTCQFFDEKLAIVLEEILTRSEEFLMANERVNLVEELRSQIDEAMKPQLVEVIQEIVGVPVIFILTDTDLNAKTSGIIALLNETPPVRDAESIPKSKKPKETSANSE